MISSSSDLNSSSSNSSTFASSLSSCVSTSSVSSPVPPVTAGVSHSRTRKSTSNKITNTKGKNREEINKLKSEEVTLKEENKSIKNILNPSVQRELLIKETDNFFSRHNIRLKKHIFPLSFPSPDVDLHSIAAEGKEMPPYTTVYRHMCNLKKRILSNWSYIRTDVNVPTDIRNANIPFYLRDFSENINAQLDSMADDLNDREFTGVLLTLHTCTFNHPSLPPNQPLSKVIGGALVECLASNERCIKAIWMHPKLNAYATKVILQVFLPRVIFEAFDIHIDNNNNNDTDNDKNDVLNNKENSNNTCNATTTNSHSTSNSFFEFSNVYKFVYAMHDDLDMCPRQTWLLLASSKFFYLPRHYESSETHNIILEYGGIHTDSGNKNFINKKNNDDEKEGTKSEQVCTNINNLNQKKTKSYSSEKNHVCECVIKKQLCKQAYLLERLIGCSEKYMYDCLPTLNERKMYAHYIGDEREGEMHDGRENKEFEDKKKNFKIEIKKGWRDFIPKNTDHIICHQVNNLIPNKENKEKEKNLEDNENLSNETIDWLRDEWCGLSKSDLMDVQSDVEDLNAGDERETIIDREVEGAETNGRKRVKRKR